MPSEYSLFATEFNQFLDILNMVLDARGHRWRHADCAVDLHEIVIRKIERDRSLNYLRGRL